MVGLHNWCFHDLTNIFTQKLSFGTLSDSIYIYIYIHDIWVFHLLYQSVTGGNPWNTMKTSITVILYPAVTSNMNIDITWNQSKSNPSKPNKTMSFLVLYFTVTRVWLSLFRTHPPFFLFLSPNPQNPTTFPGKRRISLPTFQSFSWVFNTNKSMKVVFPWCMAPKKLMLPQAQASSTKGKLLGVCGKKLRSETPIKAILLRVKWNTWDDPWVD